MKLDHENVIVNIWRHQCDWQTKNRELRVVWSMLLWAQIDTERETQDKFDAMDEVEFLVEIAWQHYYTDLALAA